VKIWRISISFWVWRKRLWRECWKRSKDRREEGFDFRNFLSFFRRNE